jgi:hypothetical protein
MTASRQTGLALSLLFFGLTTATLLHPILLHFDEAIGAGDTYEYAWRLWWFKHTLIETGQSPWVVPFVY